MYKILFILLFNPISLWCQITKGSGSTTATISTTDWEKVSPCIQCPITGTNKSFNYTKIVNGKDTINEKGVFDIQYFQNAVEYTFYPGKSFGVDEFTNIVFLLFDDRTFVRTNDPIHFNQLLTDPYFLKYDDKILILSGRQSFEFLKN